MYMFGIIPASAGIMDTIQWQFCVLHGWLIWYWYLPTFFLLTSEQEIAYYWSKIVLNKDMALCFQQLCLSFTLLIFIALQLSANCFQISVLYHNFSDLYVIYYGTWRHTPYFLVLIICSHCRHPLHIWTFLEDKMWKCALNIWKKCPRLLPQWGWISPLC